MSEPNSQRQPRVAYMGPPGTFTHGAALEAFGQAAHYVEVLTVAAIFDAVTGGDADRGVAPLENSIEGAVTSTLDGLLDSELRIERELLLPVEQCLVGGESDLRRIRRVYSHPQALAQCRRWLASHLPAAELVAASSTAAAARQAAQEAATAAVASRLAAELNGLSVLFESIQDRRDNLTRFVVIGPEDGPRGEQNKTSIVFSTPHERGALRRALQAFDREGINLTRIESRPHPDKLWEYVFFTDLEGHRLDPPVARVLSALERESSFFKLLGSYPKAARSGSRG